MSDPVATLKEYPPPAVAQIAAGIALSHLGENERPGNRGLIVRWCTKGIYSPREGIAWCALFVGQCFRQALTDRPEREAELKQWLSLWPGAANVQRMHEDLELWGWGVPDQAGSAPAHGDIVFFGKPGHLSHVGMVVRAVPGAVETIEGNSGPSGHTDRVYGHTRASWAALARCPW